MIYLPITVNKTRKQLITRINIEVRKELNLGNEFIVCEKMLFANMKGKFKDLHAVQLSHVIDGIIYISFKYKENTAVYRETYLKTKAYPIYFKLQYSYIKPYQNMTIFEL